MTPTQTMSNILFLDFETIADEEAVAALPDVEAPANYKSAEAIAKYKAERRAALVEKAATEPETARIVAVALRVYPTGQTYARLLGDPETPDETELLLDVYAALQSTDGRVAGFNIACFDLPLLMQRALMLGLKPPFVPQVRRYQSHPVCDLMQELRRWGDAGPYRGLKPTCKRLGIANPLPEVEGSQVAALWATDREKLRAYAMNDIDLEVALWERMNGIFWPRVTFFQTARAAAPAPRPGVLYPDYAPKVAALAQYLTDPAQRAAQDASGGETLMDLVEEVDLALRTIRLAEGWSRIRPGTEAVA